MTINLDTLRKIATLYPKDRVVDGDTVLALITELETFRRRFDAMRRQRDGYRNQLRKAEQQVARVRDLLAYLEKLAPGDKHYAELIDRDLDGDTRG